MAFSLEFDKMLLLRQFFESIDETSFEQESFVNPDEREKVKATVYENFQQQLALQSLTWRFFSTPTNRFETFCFEFLNRKMGRELCLLLPAESRLQLDFP